MNNMTSFKRTVAAVAVTAALSISSTAFASNNDGSLSGVVTSTSNSALSGATVVIKNEKNGAMRTVIADENGRYRVGQLPIGSYTVTVSKNGYQAFKKSNLRVRIGSELSLNSPLSLDGVEAIEVRGSAVATIDVSSSETALNIGAIELSRLPVGRDATSVALLAPGTTKGDSRFGNVASFGGASVAENSTFINGLNVTNFRNGLGFSEVPFEFYEEFQVKTGGYSAEFGRSTGGVINAVTKSGTNEWKFGANLYFSPSSLRGNAPNVYKPNGDLYIENDSTDRDRLQGNIYASGPLIKDKLFFYAIYNPRSNKTEWIGSEGSAFSSAEDKSDFWGTKIDWQISENHLLEFLAFSDSTEEVTDGYKYDYAKRERGDLTSIATDETGGDNWSVKYTGHITDDFTVSALYGVNKFNQTSSSNVGDDCALILDRTDDHPHGTLPGCMDTSGYNVEVGDDERKAMRLDFEWSLDDHIIRFGLDNEVNTSFSQQSYSGPTGQYHLIYDTTPGSEIATGVIVPDGVTKYINSRERTVSGEFETLASAYYVEDIWSATDDLTITAGIRLETFDNKNGEGKSFAKIDDMVAPRVGISWDPTGDGDSKVFANFGRYFLPVASNTNIRLSGNEFDERKYHALDGYEEFTFNGTTYHKPIFGALLGTALNGNGEAPDTRSVVDQDLDPMYQDEIILGYQGTLNDEWTWGIRGTQRKLNGAIDDMHFNNIAGCAFDDYILGNPGAETTVFVDTNCDGEADKLVTFDSKDEGYPEASRTYLSMELTANRAWDDVWSLSGSYTWAHSYGNSEGLVKSDNGQSDAGLTTDFDFPELMDGAYGNLPNDRRHMFKVYGNYAVTEDLIVGAKLVVESGRPTNKLGIGHPNGVPSYGDTYYTCASACTTDSPVYEQNTRGSAGRTGWVTTLDLNATYTMQVAETDVKFKVDVFNLLDADTVRRINEEFEESSPGQLNDTYGLATSYQTPRSVQFSVSVDF